MINTITRGLLWFSNLLPSREEKNDNILPQELHLAIKEVSEVVPRRHLRILVGLLELENIMVEEVMPPRNEIIGLNINDPWSKLLNDLANIRYKQLPIYRDSLDQIEGILKVREVLPLLLQNNFNKESLRQIIHKTYFIPEGTSLHIQLLNFQNHHQRFGLVVNEYGDIQGLLTLKDILKEIIH